MFHLVKSRERRLRSAMKETTMTMSQFLGTPQGKIVCRWEAGRMDRLVEDVFGYRALQVGMPEVDFLRANRIPMHICASDSGGLEWAGRLAAGVMAVRALAGELPFESESLDLVVLAHSLDFCGGDENAKRILREISRVMVPGGRVVLCAFNSISLWRLRQKFGSSGAYLPSGLRPVSLRRLRDWFPLLGLEIDRGCFGLYEFPCGSQAGLRRCSWMNRAGDRWWPSCGAVFMLSALKQVEGARLVGRGQVVSPELGTSGRARAAAGTAAGRRML